MITERHRGLGSWTVPLSPATPASVLRLLDVQRTSAPLARFGHVVVTPTHVDLDAVDVVTLSRFTGVLRERPNLYTLAGPGPAMWLGDEDGKGDIIEVSTTFRKSAATFATWVADLRGALLSAGTVSAVGGTLTHRFIYIDRRAALDYVCDHFAAEWRVTPQLTLNAGLAADQFVTTPTVAAIRRTGGRDSNVTGLPDPAFEFAVDAEDYTTRVVVMAGGQGTSAVGGANISPATPFEDFFGNAVRFTRMVDGVEVKAGNGNAAATAQLNRFTDVHRDLRISSDVYDVTGDLVPGDWLWVYDPELGLTDPANQVQYRGQLVFPVKLRVFGYTWPVRQGMGVYFVAPTTGTRTDLTDWVEWESGAVTLEVGATPRATAP